MIRALAKESIRGEPMTRIADAAHGTIVGESTEGTELFEAGAGC
jgi:hypothetical protein